jgi:uncharacterized protein YodC (DUF2158 family)
MTDYEPGDVVELVSGGPNLTVIEGPDDDGEVKVAWFIDDELVSSYLPEAAFRLVETEDEKDE